MKVKHGKCMEFSWFSVKSGGGPRPAHQLMQCREAKGKIYSSDQCFYLVFGAVKYQVLMKAHFTYYNSTPMSLEC